MPRVNFGGREAKDGEQGSSVECAPPMRPAYAGAVHAVLSAERRERREPAIYGDHRQAIFGDAVVWVVPNVPVHEAEQPQVWPPPCASLDAPHAIGSDLPGAQHQQQTPSAQNMA